MRNDDEAEAYGINPGGFGGGGGALLHVTNHPIAIANAATKSPAKIFHRSDGAPSRGVFRSGMCAEPVRIYSSTRVSIFSATSKSRSVKPPSV
jgi:hypothetical protein